MANVKTLAMALPRSRAIGNLTDLAHTLTTHIVKVRLMPDSRDQPHWRKEIAAYLNRAQSYTFVKGGKRLKLKDLSESLFHIDSRAGIQSIIFGLRSDYTFDNPKPSEIALIHKAVVRVYHELGPYVINSDLVDHPRLTWLDVVDAFL